MSTDNHHLFEQSFDTFKAFDNLTVANCSAEQEAFPATICKFCNTCLYGKRIN